MKLTDATAIYLGTTAITKVYRGETQIWVPSTEPVDPLRGPELISNGSFANGFSGWTAGNNAALALSGGGLQIKRTDITNPYASYTLAVAANKVYEVKISVTGGSDLSRENIIRIGSSPTTNEYFESRGTGLREITARVWGRAATWYITAELLTSVTDKTLIIDNVSVKEITDPAYGTGVYGPPLTITTANGTGVNTVSYRKRVSAALEELESNYLNVGEPYRIDIDIITAAPGTVVKIDWCDVPPIGEFIVQSGMHIGHESPGRYGGYSSTYRFTDIEPMNGATITFANLTIRRIYEFSS